MNLKSEHLSQMELSCHISAEEGHKMMPRGAFSEWSPNSQSPGPLVSYTKVEFGEGVKAKCGVMEEEVGGLGAHARASLQHGQPEG